MTALRALRVVHPFPSLLNAGLVGAIAFVAHGTPGTVFVLAAAMIALQFTIGAVNDVHDAVADAQSKPWKPIPAGLVAPGTARAVALTGAAFSILCSASHGLPVAAMAAGMLACGLVYDLWLKPTSWAWVCFSVAFAILPVYAWFGAAQTLPPRFEFLLPLAALAGPALQLSNGLVDLDADRVARVWTAAVRLGRMRTLIVMAALLLVVHGLAWLTLVGASGPSMLVVGAASSLAATGLALSTRRSVRARALGWSAQAVAICLLGAGWLAAVA